MSCGSYILSKFGRPWYRRQLGKLFQKDYKIVLEQKQYLFYTHINSNTAKLRLTGVNHREKDCALLAYPRYKLWGKYQ